MCTSPPSQEPISAPAYPPAYHSISHQTSCVVVTPPPYHTSPQYTLLFITINAQECPISQLQISPILHFESCCLVAPNPLCTLHIAVSPYHTTSSYHTVKSKCSVPCTLILPLSHLSAPNCISGQGTGLRPESVIAHSAPAKWCSLAPALKIV